MKKYTIIAASIVGAATLAMAFAASAQVGAAHPSVTAAIHARLNARFGTSTPPGDRHMGTSTPGEFRMGTSTPGMRGEGSTTRAEAEQQRAANIQGRSNTEIDARIDSLNKLLSRVDAMVNVSAADKASMSSSIQAEIASLTSLKTSIDSDTATSTLKTDYQSITKSYRVYALVLPQASITAAADRVLDLVASFNTLTTKLQGFVTTAQSNGTNVGAAVSAMADIAAKTADATTQANAALSEVSGLQPDQGATTTLVANTAALKDAQSKIKVATTDLTVARKDVNTVVGVIKSSMKATTNATVPAAAATTTVSASTTTE
ncbi:MAG: hypothetical protein P4L61_00115 [Candidatus Pacebacteria bacterium]|nr:hypothetical protein [Candidatus Paceibacterota bacterium]